MKGRQTPCFARTLVSHNDSRVIAMRKNKKKQDSRGENNVCKRKKSLAPAFYSFTFTSFTAPPSEASGATEASDSSHCLGEGEEREKKETLCLIENKGSQ
jgi:hypothetical protein